MEQLVRDVRHTIRLLIADRGFAVAALLTTALGIGGAAAMFSVVYGVLLRPLPYPAAERLVRLWEEHPGSRPRAGFRAVISRPTLLAWSRDSNTLEAIGSYTAGNRVMSRAGAVQRLRGASVTPSIFQLLGIAPMTGRLFSDADVDPGAAPVVVLTEATWREQFGGDPSAIGALVRIDDEDRRIVGVTPRGFAFPPQEVGAEAQTVAFYTPLRIPDVDAAARVIGIHVAIARLRAGVTAAQAEAEGTARARHVDRPMADLVFGKGQPVEVRVRPIVDQLTSDVRPVLTMLAGGVGLVLLIACANLANLFLARGHDRARELAVRAALGAARGRLLQQLLTESLTIALAGGALGFLFGWVLTAAIPVLAPATFPRVGEIRVDLWFVVAAVSAAALVGALSGMLPALRGSRIDLVAAMNASGGRTAGDPGRPLRRGLLVVQASFAVVLLVGAALLARSLIALVNVDAGYRPANVLTADLHVPGAPDGGRRLGEVTSTVLTRLRGVPGVEAAGAGSLTPFGATLNISGFVLPGQTTPDGQPVTARAFHTIITPGYIEALGMRLKEGRRLRAEDVGAPTITMLINERFVRTYLNDGHPVVGRRFAGMFPRMLGRNDAAVEIIGVVQDVLPDGFDGAAEPQIYLPFGAGFQLGDATIVVRTAQSGAASASGALPATIRGMVAQASPGATLDRIGSLESRVSASAAQPRFVVSVLGAFAAMALALAAAGLYAALSYDVARQRREIGVRAALGATRRDLVTMVVREGVQVTVIGLIVGIGVAALAARTMSAVLFGVAPFDPLSFAIAPTVLLATAVAACLIPARKAARIDPIDALRAH